MKSTHAQGDMAIQNVCYTPEYTNSEQDNYGKSKY